MFHKRPLLKSDWHVYADTKLNDNPGIAIRVQDGCQHIRGGGCMTFFDARYGVDELWYYRPTPPKNSWAREYYKFLVNGKQFGEVFPIKNMSYNYQYGFKMNVDCPRDLAWVAGVALRSPFENRSYGRLIDEAWNNGLNMDEAIAFAYLFEKENRCFYIQDHSKHGTTIYPGFSVKTWMNATHKPSDKKTWREEMGLSWGYGTKLFFKDSSVDGMISRRQVRPGLTFDEAVEYMRNTD